jgi:predicted RNA-binding protein YlqC (UPF0109 family)
MEKEQIQNLIKDLVEKITLNTPQITVNEEKGNNLWFSVVVNEPHHFTSKEGEALQALNHLVRRIIEAKNPIQANIHPTERKKELSFSIDINDFQKRKVEAVRADESDRGTVGNTSRSTTNSWCPGTLSMRRAMARAFSSVSTHTDGRAPISSINQYLNLI